MKKRGSSVKLILEVLEYVQKRVNGNIEKQNNIIYLPVYMTYLIKEKEANSMMVDVDLSDL